MDSLTKDLVSIVTVSYNSHQVTLELLESLKHISYANIEVIVVDNGSKYNPKTEVLKLYPDAVFLRSEKNLGFAGGNNLGFRVAKGKYICLLNNDTEVDPHFLEPIIQVFNQNADAGIVASKLWFHHSPQTLQYAGSTELNHYTISSYAIGYGQIDKGQYNKIVKTPIAHGAAMTVSRAAMQKAGLLAEQFFLYYEELDWCERIKKQGFSIYFQPNSLVYHKESMSVGKGSSLQTHYKTRNRILYVRRNSKGLTKWIALVYLMLIAAPIHLLKHILKGENELAKAYLKALKWHFSSLSDIKTNYYL